MTASGKNTEQFTKAQLAVANSSKNLQSLGFSLAEAAIPAVELFATTLDKATSFIDKRLGLGGTKTTRSGVNRGSRPGRESDDEDKRAVGSAEARGKAESYLGRKIDDKEFSDLIKATHAEAAAGAQASQKEQAMIMASILNRARDKNANITDILKEKNQFQAVTGTRYEPGPSKQFREGPGKDRQKSIEGATDYLDSISRQQKNFTAANAAAYGKGTNIGYRDKMLAAGGTQVGGSVFNTEAPATNIGAVAGPKSGYRPTIKNELPNRAGSETTAQANQANNQQQTESANDRMIQRLDELVALQRQNNNINAKLLQNTRG
jgi:hypothetical protein